MAAEQDIRKIVKQIERAIGQAVSRKEMLRLGKLAVTIIQRRTRRGRAVRKSGGSVRNLKPLSRSYIEKRKRNRSSLSRFTSPGRSNLTFTGQMLSSMNATVRRPGSVTIGFKGTRRGGGRNAKIAEYVSKQRPFNNLARKEINALVEDFDKSFQAVLDRALRGS